VPVERQATVAGFERPGVVTGVCRERPVDRGLVPEAIHQLLATDVALDKLGARGISGEEAEQLPRNQHVLVRNPREQGEPGKRLLLIGCTDGARLLTLVIERTMEPTTWLVVTGWSSTPAERKILKG